MKKKFAVLSALGVDRVGVVRLFLELEQRSADLGEVLRRLLDEDGAVLRQVQA